MDVDVPVMNGFEAIRKLIKKFPDAKVIIVSNYINDELKKNATAIKYFLKDNLIDVKNYLQTKR